MAILQLRPLSHKAAPSADQRPEIQTDRQGTSTVGKLGPEMIINVVLHDGIQPLRWYQAWYQARP